MKIAISGSSGYLGKYLSNEFYKYGHDVIELKRNDSKTISKFKYQNFDLNFNIQCDLSRIDILIHCAYDFSKKKWESIRETNINKSIELINLAKCSGVKKIFFISTQSAFEECQSNYGKAKFEIEKKIQGDGVIILRPGLIIGADLGGIAYYLYLISKLSFILPIPYNSKTKLYLCHRKDLFNVIDLIIKNNYYSFDPIYISDHTPLSLEDVIKQIVKIKKIKQPYILKLNPKLFYIIIYIIEKIFNKIRIGTDNLTSLLNTNPNINFKEYKTIQKKFIK